MHLFSLCLIAGVGATMIGFIGDAPLLTTIALISFGALVTWAVGRAVDHLSGK